jgi:hypothetical protein
MQTIANFEHAGEVFEATLKAAASQPGGPAVTGMEPTFFSRDLLHA